MKQTLVTTDLLRMFTYCLDFKLVLVFGRVFTTGVLGICARDCVLYKGPVDVTISPRKRGRRGSACQLTDIHWSKIFVR